MTDYADTDTSAATAAVRRASPKLKAAATSAHEAYDSLKDAAVSAVGETREKVVDLATEAAGEVERRYGDLQAWVQLRPGQALGIAAGVGVLVGLLLRGGSTKTIYLRDAR